MPMLRTSSDMFPASRDVTRGLPYVVRIDFSELAREPRRIVGRPIACHKCGAVLLSADQIKEDSRIGRHFVCSFCGTLNVIEGEIVSAGSDTDFVVSPPPKETTTTETQPAPAAGKAFLAVIDVSGSMAGANLAAVKRSLSNSIDSLAANSPETMFGLIEFESSVVIRDLETGAPIQIPPGSYASLERVMDATRRLLDRVKMIPVGTNADRLKHHVRQLRDKGGTALGPAVAAAYVIAKHRGVGRVVLLTDGLANEGVGALEGYQVTPAKEFYEQIARMFNDVGVIFDVVGIASGSGMELQTIGLIPEITGGQMYYVTPSELDKYMARLSGASILGRDVEVRVITPPGVRVGEVSGLSPEAARSLAGARSSRIGAVADTHEIYLSMEPTHEIESETVPIQIQVEYTDDEGARHLRAVTTELKVARREDELLASFDPTLSAAFAVQKAGEEAFHGHQEAGASKIRELRHVLRAMAAAAPSHARESFETADRIMAEQEEDLEEQIQVQAEAAAAPPFRAAMARDMMASMNISKMRARLDELVREDDEEDDDDE